MRRPLKPFVTEYKGARRPPSNQPQGFESTREAEPQSKGFGPSNGATQRSPWPNGGGMPPNERPRPRSFDTSTMSEPEDSYEAALRAADALFARPASPPPGSAAPRPATEAAAAQPDDTAHPTRGGRILPVLDEAPSPQLAALEAAYAPKRRGRKPGSKNKPKPAVSDAEVPDASATIFYNGPAATGTIEAREPAPAEEASEHLFQAPAIQTLEALSTVRGPRVPRRIGKDDGRIKPGEAWKRRRLPRVCW